VISSGSHAPGKLREAMGTPPPCPAPIRVALTLEQCWHRVPGGTASAALGSIDALRRHGDPDGRARPELVAVAAWHLREAPAPWTPSIEVRHLRLPRPALYETWHRLRWPPVERATGPVDVIHVTGMAMPPPSSPLVVTVNDLVFVHHPELFTRRGVRFFERAMELTRREASIVVCPSMATIADCIAHGFAPERLRLVPYGLDPPAVDGEDVARVRAAFGIEGPYVLWLGTIEPRKNLPSLLAAFSGLDHETSLVIAGGAGWNEDLDRLVEPMGSRVKRIGFVTEQDKAALYAGASIFCLPSLQEGFGLPVLEAMAQGTAVITSAGTSTEELVAPGAEGGEAAGVLVEPHDVDALSAAMRALLEDEQERERLAVAGRARAGEYSSEQVARRLVSAYLEARS